MDTSEADMSVDVNIRPEVRGELDCIKLARLLQVLPVISSTFSRVNCLAAVSAADRSMKAQPTLPFSASVLDMTVMKTITRRVSLMGVGDDDDPFGTPPESPPMKLKKEITPRRVREEDPNLTLPDLVDEILAEATLDTERIEGEVEVEVVEDPTHISMVVNLQIPEVALDLTYDVSKGRHLVLALRMLEMKIIFRPHDMQVLRPALPNLTPPHPILPCPTLPCPTLPCPTLPYPTLFYPTLPYPAPPYPAFRLCCAALSCAVLCRTVLRCAVLC